MNHRASARRRRLILVAGLVLVAGAAWILFPRDPARPSAVTGTSTSPAVSATAGAYAAGPKTRFEDFVGAEACAGCHRNEYDRWKSSTHGQAGGPPAGAKIIAKFDGRPLRFKDAVVTPTTNATGDYLFIVEPSGLPKSEIKVDAVVGGGHMHGGGTQSFFQKFQDGTVRFLPFDFIRNENLWFVQLRRDKTWVPVSEEISLQADLANWPPHRVLGTLTEFSNCQNCHGSQISTRYDEGHRRYETRYQTLRINCESCHGPGRRHIEIVSKPGFESQADIGMKPLATLSRDASLMVCFQCHAKKDAIREGEYFPGDPLEEFFSLKLGLLGDNPFLVDGRVRSFDYQSNHLFSDCYLSGSMTCVDCHDPHSLSYRDVFSKPLVGKFDNRQCTSCHASKALTPEQHSHHKTDSPGNLCTSCHMPFLQHPGVGTNLVFARSDHTIPIPRPAFDHQLGIENACQKCHAEKGLAWQEAKVKEWYGQLKPHNTTIASRMQAAKAADSIAAARLLLVPDARHPMGQAASLAEWIERFLRPAMPDGNGEALAKLQTFAQSSELDLKALGLLALHIGFDHAPDVRALLENQLRRHSGLNDPLRNRWAIAADNLGSLFAARGEVPAAIVCFQKSLAVKPDNFVTMSHLALAFLRAGRPQDAITWLKKAVQVKPTLATLHFQLAQTYAQLQQIPEAVAALEAGLKHAPEDSRAKQMLEQLRQR